MERLKRLLYLITMNILIVLWGLAACQDAVNFSKPSERVLEETLTPEQQMIETSTIIPFETLMPIITMTASLGGNDQCNYQKIFESDIVFYEYFRTKDEIFLQDRDEINWYLFDEKTNAMEVVSESLEAILIYQSQQKYIQSIREQDFVGAYKFYDDDTVIYSFIEEGRNKTTVEIHLDNIEDNQSPEYLIEIQGVVANFFWLDEENVVISMQWHVPADRVPEDYVYLLNIAGKSIVPIVEKGKPYFNVDLGGVVGRNLLLSSTDEQKLISFSLEDGENTFDVLPVKATFTYDILEDSVLLMKTIYANGQNTIMVLNLASQEVVCEFEVPTESKIVEVFVLGNKLQLLSENGILTVLDHK
jgi:hypothetical protein